MTTYSEITTDNTWIEWVEPMNKKGDPVYMRVSKQTAIATIKEAGLTRTPPYEYTSDAEALGDFVTVHWAWYCKAPEGEREESHGQEPR